MHIMLHLRGRAEAPRERGASSTFAGSVCTSSFDVLPGKQNAQRRSAATNTCKLTPEVKAASRVGGAVPLHIPMVANLGMRPTYI